MSGYQIEIPHNAGGIAVTEIDFAVRGLDVNNLISPNKSAIRTNAPDSVAAECAPRFDCITHDLPAGNGSQTIAGKQAIVR